jgi:hypothetical protein
VYKLMPTLTNSPQDVTVIEAEARKSFAFGIWLKNSNGDAVDISNSQTSFTLGKYDKYGVATVLVSKDFNVVAPSLGYMTVFVDADQLNYKPDTYYFTVTLRIQGYSVVLMKGDFALQQNMEFDSINHDYVATNPAQSVEVTLREALNVHVTLSALLPPNLVIPTDASDLAVAGYVSNPASATRTQLDLVYVDNTELANGLASKPNTSTVVLKSLYTAKGAILVGTGVSTPSTLPLGSQDQVLVVDTSLAGGVKWAALTAAQIPALDATKITTGTLALARIPTMDAAHIPALDASKITTGIFLDAQLPVRINSMGRGTTAQRDAYFGVPGTTAQVAALANQMPVWYNTDKGWEEIYYAPVGTAGLTALGLISTAFAMWYPVSGKLPHFKQFCASTGIGGIGNNQYCFRNAYVTAASASNLDNMSVDATTGKISIVQPGRYRPGWSFTQSTVSGASHWCCRDSCEYNELYVQQLPRWTRCFNRELCRLLQLLVQWRNRYFKHRGIRLCICRHGSIALYVPRLRRTSLRSPLEKGR